MEWIAQVFVQAVEKTVLSFVHNWPYLALSLVIAVWLKVVIKPEKVSAFLMRYKDAGVLAATAAAVATPLCSCGTTAIILGMAAGAVPWAPIVAFMVASPLTSPQELVYSAGVFGWPFAIAFFVSSILLGFAGGAVAGFMERRGWLKNQSRFKSTEPRPVETTSTPTTAQAGRLVFQQSLEPVRGEGLTLAMADGCACATVEKSEVETGCGCKPKESVLTKESRLGEITRETLDVGGRLLWMFGLFAFIGYFLNGLIPVEWVSALFGAGNIYSVPLAATIGLPFYINTEASLPLIRALMDGGMSQGAALAFLITGAGVSIGSMGGALTIARWRVTAIVVGTLWLGAILIGFGYNAILQTGIL